MRAMGDSAKATVYQRGRNVFVKVSVTKRLPWENIEYSRTTWRKLGR